MERFSEQGLEGHPPSARDKLHFREGEALTSFLQLHIFCDSHHSIRKFFRLALTQVW